MKGRRAKLEVRPDAKGEEKFMGRDRALADEGNAGVDGTVQVARKPKRAAEPTTS